MYTWSTPCSKSIIILRNMKFDTFGQGQLESMSLWLDGCIRIKKMIVVLFLETIQIGCIRLHLNYGFDETFAMVSHIESIRLLFGLAFYFRLKLY